MINELDMVDTLSVPRLLDYLDVTQVLPVQVFEFDTAWVQSKTLVFSPVKLVILLKLWHQLCLALIQIHDILQLVLLEGLAILQRSKPVLTR